MRPIAASRPEPSTVVDRAYHREQMAIAKHVEQIAA
jgi:hypothetical protein